MDVLFACNVYGVYIVLCSVVWGCTYMLGSGMRMGPDFGTAKVGFIHNVS